MGRTVTIITMGKTEANCQKLASRFTALETQKKSETNRSWDKMLNPNPTPAPTGCVRQMWQAWAPSPATFRHPET